MIIRSQIVSPSRYKGYELGLTHTPSIENNHFVRITNDIIDINFRYKPKAIFYEPPSTAYIILEFNEPDYHQRIPEISSFNTIVVKLEFEITDAFIVNLNNETELELPDMPKWKCFISNKQGDDFLGYYCKRIEIRCNLKPPLIEVEEKGSYLSTLKFIELMGYPISI